MDRTFSEVHPRGVEDLTWLLTETTKLEDTRNNVVHAPLHLLIAMKHFNKRSTTTSIMKRAMVAPHVWFLNRRAIRIDGKDLLVEFHWCREMAVTLRNFALALSAAVRPSPRPWPERPRLPARQGSKSSKPRRQASP